MNTTGREPHCRASAAPVERPTPHLGSLPSDESRPIRRNGRRSCRRTSPRPAFAPRVSRGRLRTWSRSARLHWGVVTAQCPEGTDSPMRKRRKRPTSSKKAMLFWVGPTRGLVTRGSKIGIATCLQRRNDCIVSLEGGHLGGEINGVSSARHFRRCRKVESS